jgi:hypothetical protein
MTLQNLEIKAHTKNAPCESLTASPNKLQFFRNRAAYCLDGLDQTTPLRALQQSPTGNDKVCKFPLARPRSDIPLKISGVSHDKVSLFFAWWGAPLLAYVNMSMKNT